MVGLVGQTALGWAGAVDGGKSVDGEDGGCVCAGGGERAVCELVEVGRVEEGAAGSPQRGCCGPPEREGRG